MTPQGDEGGVEVIKPIVDPLVPEVVSAFAPDPEDVRAEYSALSGYHHTLVTFRFTLLGFYLAAVGLIVSGGFALDEALLLFPMSLALWLVELRTRGLLMNVVGRGVKIERHLWGYRGKHAYEPFYSHLTRSVPDDDPNAGSRPQPDYTVIWNRVVKLDIHYTHALDLVFLGVAAFALLKAIGLVILP